MDIKGHNLAAGPTVRTATGQQDHVAPTPAHKNHRSDTLRSTDRYLNTSVAIIEAEYVDLYSPIRRPPQQQNQQHSLIVEKEQSPDLQSAEPGANKRNQQLISRYGQGYDLPLPGSYLSLLA